jgi:hypothetical protein
MPARKVKKSGGSPNEVTVTFKFLSGKKHEVKVKNGATYGDVLNIFLDSPNGSGYVGTGTSFLVKSKRLITEEQLEELITEDIDIHVTQFNRSEHQYVVALESYNKNKKNKDKIATLKKELPATLKLASNKVNAINFKPFKINSASSDKEINEEEDIVLLEEEINNNKFRTAYNKNDLAKWLKQSDKLPHNRQPVTRSEIKKIDESVGYGEIIKIGQSPRASTSRDTIMNNFMNIPAIRAPRPAINNEEVPRARNNDIYAQMYLDQIEGRVPSAANREWARARAAETNRRNSASTGRSSISATPSPSARSSARRSSARTLPSGSESRSYDRSSAPSLPPGSPLSSRASTNNPDGSPRPNSRRSSATPRASPRSMARANARA